MLSQVVERLKNSLPKKNENEQSTAVINIDSKMPEEERDDLVQVNVNSMRLKEKINSLYSESNVHQQVLSELISRIGKLEDDQQATELIVPV